MGLVRDIGNHLWQRMSLKTIGQEIAATITDRIIPHGAAELAHAFMTQGSGYVPYGQETIPVAEAEAAAPANEAPPTMAEQYQAQLAMNAQAARHEGPDQSQTLSL